MREPEANTEPPADARPWGGASEIPAGDLPDWRFVHRHDFDALRREVAGLKQAIEALKAELLAAIDKVKRAAIVHLDPD